MDSQPFAIRPLEPTDVPEVAGWLAQAEPWRTLGFRADEWPSYFAQLTGDASREADVLALDGRVAGISVVRRRVLLGDYLELLAVVPEARGRGLGASLLAHLEHRAFARAMNVFLCVSDFNLDARAFYRRAGYEEVGILDELLVPGRAEILMRKTRGPARSGRSSRTGAST